ncbi:hypothetical protein [Dechloromonas sp. H13]|uniref:hypothetical protein n=1 Tax=Dechloromonas sp. H13 TaxID=2570193 RepID=UPI00129139C3|nr:hypothetical protein [Dechloromonas sp. H13]
MKIIIALIFALLMAACASYDGRGLKPGISTGDEVVKLMGEPAMRWREPDGSELLAYPRGPAGFNTFMVRIDSKGTLASIEGVLDMKHFSLIRPDMSQDDVLRILGPSQPQWTVYFERRDELVWEWRYCDDWNEPARFNVLFDNTSGKVRSTQSYTESMLRRFRQVCSR